MTDSGGDLLQLLTEVDREVAMTTAAAFEYQQEHAKQEPLARLVVFSLADNWFGFHLRHVTEVDYAPSVTPIPGVSGWLSGATHRHGEILSVVDLPQFFQISKTNGAVQRLLVVRSLQNDLRAGLLVGRLGGIRTPLPDLTAEVLLPAAVAPFVESKLKLTDHPVVVLDCEKLLSSPRFLDIGTDPGEQHV